MYQYKIENPDRLGKEIDQLLSFQGRKEVLKKCLFEKIITDAKENVDQVTPEKLFDPQRFGVWFHSIFYPKLYSDLCRYDTFVVYYCQIADNRQDVILTLE